MSSQLFFIGMISKVFAAISPYDIQTDYGIQTAYGIEILPIYKGLRIGKAILPIILFIIGIHSFQIRNMSQRSILPKCLEVVILPHLRHKDMDDDIGVVHGHP